MALIAYEQERKARTADLRRLRRALRERWQSID